MRLYLKYHFSLFLFLSFTAFGVFSQEPNPEKKSGDLEIDLPPPVRVGEIFLVGNKKTRDAIILREIPFHTGDSFQLADLVHKFEIARKQLFNTALFTEVVVAAKNITGDNIDIIVKLKERNYLFPLPYFRPVDRNLNQWLVEKHASLDRINYGAKIYYNNATGNNDKLRIGLTGGYTKQFSFSYDRLYFDKKMKWGLKLSFAAGKNHELNYNTVNDKQVFIKDENDYLRKFSNSSVQFTFRPAIKTRHSLGFGFITETVSDTIVALNPAYFKSGRKTISYPGIYYTMNYYDLDYIPYPKKGYAAEISIGKSGFNDQLNIWQLQVKGLACWPVSKTSFITTNIYSGIKLPFKQPYFNQRMLGYGEVYMQGFEYFVIDGVAGAYLKTAWNKRLLGFDLKMPAGKKGKDPMHIPFAVYGKVFGNSGYVYQPDPGENTLSNTMLWSGGIGIDIVTLYDVTIKLEWSFNSLGQNGLFLHRKTIF